MLIKTRVKNKSWFEKKIEINFKLCANFFLYELNKTELIKK